MLTSNQCHYCTGSGGGCNISGLLRRHRRGCHSTDSGGGGEGVAGVASMVPIIMGVPLVSTVLTDDHLFTIWSSYNFLSSGRLKAARCEVFWA